MYRIQDVRRLAHRNGRGRPFKGGSLGKRKSIPFENAGCRGVPGRTLEGCRKKGGKDSAEKESAASTGGEKVRECLN